MLTMGEGISSVGGPGGLRICEQLLILLTHGAGPMCEEKRTVRAGKPRETGF